MASTPIPRRLPAVPQSNWRLSARPLPTVPQSLLCKRCNARITSSAMVLPLAAVSAHATRRSRGLPVCSIRPIHGRRFADSLERPRSSPKCALHQQLVAMHDSS